MHINSDIVAFIDYVYEFYGPEGIFPIPDLKPSELINACLYAIQTVGERDTYTREVARDHILFHRGEHNVEYKKLFINQNQKGIFFYCENPL